MSKKGKDQRHRKAEQNVCLDTLRAALGKQSWNHQAIRGFLKGTLLGIRKLKKAVQVPACETPGDEMRCGHLPHPDCPWL